MAGEPQHVHALETPGKTAPLRIEDGRRLLDLDRYAPYFLATITATLSARSSARFRADLGVGVSDWRVIASLAQHPGATASQMVEVVALDKAAISRALAGLSARNLVDAIPGERDPRRKLWFLTEPGWSLHDALLDRALQQEEILTRGISPTELEACLDVLRRMQRNITPALDDPALDDPALA